MKTRYLGTGDKDIKEAAEIIRAGGLVGFPTETVYGLGGDALDPEASRRIYAAKGRPSDNPLIVHISDPSQLSGLAAEIPEGAYKLAEAFWPGPLTMVFRKKPGVPDETTGGLATVAVRLPASATARKLIELSGTPIAAPSANLSGRPSPTRWEHVKEDLDGRIDAIIQGEPCGVGIESTVLDMTCGEPVVLRPGYITPEMIGLVLGREISYDPAITGKPDPSLVPRAPGMKYKHYAPKADMILFSGKPESVKRAIRKKALEKRAEGLKVAEFTETAENVETAARDFFAKLREADEDGADLILAAAAPEGDQLGFSLMNRMLKAAGYHIEEVPDMKIALGSDHGGFALKNALIEHLKGREYEVLDLGTYSEESVDYPVYGKKTAEAVASGEADLGIVCCGTGIGISIAANKVKGIRCAVVTNDYMAEMTKRHNNANMLAFGGRVISPEDAIRMTDIWLDTEYEGGRHARRVAMLDEM